MYKCYVISNNMNNKQKEVISKISKASANLKLKWEKSQYNDIMYLRLLDNNDSIEWADSIMIYEDATMASSIGTIISFITFDYAKSLIKEFIIYKNFK